MSINNRMPPSSDSDTTSSHSDSKESSSTAATSVDNQHQQAHDPQADFKGDVKVSKALPTKGEWSRCMEMPVLDVENKERMFGSLYANERGPSRHLIVFVRHFFCGVSSSLSSPSISSTRTTAHTSPFAELSRIPPHPLRLHPSQRSPKPHHPDHHHRHRLWPTRPDPPLH